MFTFVIFVYLFVFGGFCFYLASIGLKHLSQDYIKPIWNKEYRILIKATTSKWFLNSRRRRIWNRYVLIILIILKLKIGKKHLSRFLSTLGYSTSQKCSKYVRQKNMRHKYVPFTVRLSCAFINVYFEVSTHLRNCLYFVIVTINCSVMEFVNQEDP